MLGFAWFYSSETGLFNGLRAKKLKKSRRPSGLYRNPLPLLLLATRVSLLSFRRDPGGCGRLFCSIEICWHRILFLSRDCFAFFASAARAGLCGSGLLREENARRTGEVPAMSAWSRFHAKAILNSRTALNCLALVALPGGSACPAFYSARTRAFAALSVASRLRSGRPKGSHSISNTSPFSVFTPSLNESVAVPKKWTWTSPGRRNRPYLK